MSTAKSPLYIGNHTTSSKGYAKMARQMIANGGNTFAFLPEIREADGEGDRSGGCA